jgi:hypothetical protein
VEELPVLKQHHVTHLASPMMQAFAAVLDVVAKGRWAGAMLAPNMLPQVGSRYEQQRGKVLRRGKVLACLRPVSLTLQETLLDPPCCVQLRLHWRLEPLENGSLLLLDARFSLNGAASLRRRHWSDRIQAHCTRMLGAVQARLDAPEPAPERAPLQHAHEEQAAEVRKRKARERLH